VRDGLEVAAGLVLGLMAGFQVWRSIGAQVPKYGAESGLRLFCPDDVNGSAGWLFVVVYPPRLQGFEVCAVAMLSMLDGELRS
jgi:hypothetical protein